MGGYSSGGQTLYPAVGHSPGSRHRCRGIVGGEHASSPSSVSVDVTATAVTMAADVA